MTKTVYLNNNERLYNAIFGLENKYDPNEVIERVLNNTEEPSIKDTRPVIKISLKNKKSKTK